MLADADAAADIAAAADFSPRRLSPPFAIFFCYFRRLLIAVDAAAAYIQLRIAA